MTGTLFRLFMILLPISHLMICSRAVPITRTENLLQASQVHLIHYNRHKVMMNEKKWHWDEEPTITERMDLQLNDYPPSGPNGRHTPRAP